MIASSLLERARRPFADGVANPGAEEALQAFSTPRADGGFGALAGSVRRFSERLAPEHWLSVLVEVDPDADPSEWLDRVRPAGFPAADDDEVIRQAFEPLGGFQSGLSLAGLGMVSLRIPPSRDLLEWIHASKDVANLWNAAEEVSLPEPESATGSPWTGHDLVLGVRSGRYPRWFRREAAGKGITIAVLDTGISEQHVAFRGKVAARVDFTGSGPGDRFGHGSHCAGIAAAGPYAGGSLHGIAPAAKLLDVKVIGDGGSGTTAGILLGLEWALQQGARVISMSLGSTEIADGRSILSRKVQEIAERRNAFVAVSAGNSGPRSGSITIPGDAKDACTVGAVDQERRVTPFSSRGPTRHADLRDRNKPDLCAPGAAVAGPAAPGSHLFPGSSRDEHILLTGTSMAAPFAAGAAAVVFSTRGGASLTPTEVRSLLTRGTSPASGEGASNPTVAGAGILDLDKVMTHRKLMLFVPRRIKTAAGIAALASAVAVIGYFGYAPAKAIFSGTTQSVPDLQRAMQDGNTPAESHLASGHSTTSVQREGQQPTTPQVSDPDARPAHTTSGVNPSNGTDGAIRVVVSRGATLEGLATHFRTSQQAIIAANPSIRSGGLAAGKEYVFPLGDQKIVDHEVRPGDTIGDLTWVFESPNKYSVRTWNELASDNIRTGDTLVFLLPPSAAVRTCPQRPADIDRPRVFRLWEDERLLEVVVSPGLTLTDLAFHMQTDLPSTMRACRRRMSALRVGDRCLFDISHLEPVLYQVQLGDTLDSLVGRFGLPNRYSIRTWNQLGDDTIGIGSELLLLTESPAGLPARKGLARADRPELHDSADR